MESNPSLAAIAAPMSESAPTSAVRKSSPPGHAPGDILAGKYEIISLLGEGGMGTVWRARSIALDSDVAIKVLHRDRADSPAAQRLLREARATARVGHPSIVRAFDFGETEAGEPFLVMELLEGISLADWLDRRGSMSPIQAVQMLLPIAAGLAAAHARGIVHRDIKPENIIIVPDGVSTFLPKIVDFGIAKLSRRNNQVITQAGMVLGSLEYMSPEQAEGKQEVGEQTDVWALCVVLYELITGHRPFEGESITKMIYALYTLDPTPITSFAVGDDDLWAILARGLEKSPENRWKKMLDLGTALAVWATQHGTMVDASGRSLALHWLGSAPASPAQDESPISWSGPVGAPSWPRVSFAFIDAAAPTEARPAIVDHSASPRAGTIELARATSQRRIATATATAAPARRARSSLAALIAVPLLLAAAVFAGTSGPDPRQPTIVASAASEIPTGINWPSTIPDQPDTGHEPVVAVAAPKPIGSASVAVKPRDQKPALVGTGNRTSKSMPLPTAPNF
ncbi:MAG: serine/threonine-protein kinase [Byssovorax sp.]